MSSATNPERPGKPRQEWAESKRLVISTKQKPNHWNWGLRRTGQMTSLYHQSMIYHQSQQEGSHCQIPYSPIHISRSHGSQFFLQWLSNCSVICTCLQPCFSDPRGWLSLSLMLSSLSWYQLGSQWAHLKVSHPKLRAPWTARWVSRPVEGWVC